MLNQEKNKKKSYKKLHLKFQLRIKYEYMKCDMLWLLKQQTFNASPDALTFSMFAFIILYFHRIKILKDEKTECEMNTKRQHDLNKCAHLKSEWTSQRCGWKTKIVNDVELLQVQQKPQYFNIFLGTCICKCVELCEKNTCDLIILFGALWIFSGTWIKHLWFRKQNRVQCKHIKSSSFECK